MRRHFIFVTHFTVFIVVSSVIICPIAIAYSMGQITRNSSEDEIANVNFLYDDIVHTVKIQ